MSPAFLLRLALILAAGFWVYAPSLRGGWLWDDDLLITQNALIQDPAGWWKIWLEPAKLVDYFPLKATAEWIEWRLWHHQPLGFRVTNLVLHLGASLLVWRLFHRFGLKHAWLGGLIFAIHPVNVESVAWISEIKNTLSLPIFLLALLAYLRFDEHGRRRDYFLALFLFLAAMLCKTSMAMFPFVILLHAWWKRDRIAWADLKTAAPFFAISFALGVITLHYFRINVDTADIPMGDRLARLVAAGLTAAFYFSKCVLPIGLMPIYPRWIIHPANPLEYLPYPVAIAALLVCWAKRKSWGRHALLGLGFFLLMLAPFVAIIPMGYTWAMDHLVYIPLIGVVGLAVAALENVGKQLPKSGHCLFIAIVTATVAFLAVQSHAYAAVFKNQQSLWSRAVAENAGAWTAYNNLAAAFAVQGDFDTAIGLYRQSLQLHPSPDAYNNLGLALMQTDRLPEAIAAFQASLQLNSKYTITHNRLGFALMEDGREPEAKQQFLTALQIDPKDDYARKYLAQIEASEKAKLPDQ